MVNPLDYSPAILNAIKSARFAAVIGIYSTEANSPIKISVTQNPKEMIRKGQFFNRHALALGPVVWFAGPEIAERVKNAACASLMCENAAIERDWFATTPEYLEAVLKLEAATIYPSQPVASHGELIAQLRARKDFRGKVA